MQFCCPSFEPGSFLQVVQRAVFGGYKQSECCYMHVLVQVRPHDSGKAAWQCSTPLCTPEFLLLLAVCMNINR